MRVASLRPVHSWDYTALAKKLLAEESKRAKARESARKKGQPPPGGSTKGTAAAKVAKAVGVSARSVERAVAIDKTAIKEVKQAVESGDMSLREAERVAKLPKARYWMCLPARPKPG